MWLLLLIVLSSLAVALGSTLGIRQEAPRALRVWGGPTEGPAPVNLRLELRDPDPLRSSAPENRARIQLSQDDGATVTQTVAFDDDNAFVSFPPQRSTVSLSIWLGSDRLIAGRIRLTRDDYWRQRRRRGGPLHGRRDGNLEISVVPREGVLAIGQLGHLDIQVTGHDGQPVQTELNLQLDGLERAAQDLANALHSNAQGLLSLTVIPRDLSASLQVTAGPSVKPDGSFFSSVPIESSAMSGKVIGNRVKVVSSIPVARIYYALVNADGRWAGGGIQVHCAGSDPCAGEASLNAVPTLPAWLMLGTEPALDGPNVIGWPTAELDANSVPESVTVPDQLLLDGWATTAATVAQDKRSRFFRAMTGIGVASLLVVGIVAIQLLRARRDATSLVAGHPETAPLLKRQSSVAVAMLTLFALAIATLVAWVKMRIIGG